MIYLYMLMIFINLLNIFYVRRYLSIYLEIVIIMDIGNILKCFLRESKRFLLCVGCYRKLISNFYRYFM